MAEKQKKPPPQNLPSPIVFGPDWPKFKMFMRLGRQVFESRTNQNLYLSDAHFDDAGTYPMSKLIDHLGVCETQHREADWWFCPSLVRNYHFHRDAAQVTDLELHEEPDIDSCPALSTLLNYSPESHRTFFRKYFLNHWRRRRTGFQYAFKALIEEDGPILRWSVQTMLDRGLLAFPALVPEVWLAAVGAERTVEDEEYLGEHPQRVDYVMLASGRRVVIEVDGPNHYSEWNASLGEYLASESVYTKNLRIERSLRRQGWEIHRFSRLEVKHADLDGFEKITHALPGRSPFIWITKDALREYAVDDDIPF